MKRLTLAALAVALCLALPTGCTSVDVCNQGKDMVVIQNSGFFLLCCLPLFSGDPDYPNQQVCNWFDDTVKLKTNIRLLNEEIRRQGALGARNIVSHREDDVYYYLVFKRKIYRTSAELIRP